MNGNLLEYVYHKLIRHTLTPSAIDTCPAIKAWRTISIILPRLTGFISYHFPIYSASCLSILRIIFCYNELLMKVAYFTDTFLPQINGVVTSLVTIASAMMSNGHQITVFAPKPKRVEKTSFSAKGISLELLSSMPSFFYPDWRAAVPISPKLLLKVKRLDPDIIHFQTTFLVGGGGIILGKILKKPVIGSFHGYFMEPEYLKILNINRGVKVLSTILWKYAAFFFNQCDVVLTYSEGAKKDLKQHEVKKPIFVIPNAINEKTMKKASEKEVSRLRQRYGLNKKVVLYVGRVSAEKSLDNLVKSFSYVLKNAPDTTLLIVGDGPIRKNIMHLCSDLKIEKNVVFAGNIPQEILLTKGYYQLADVFATASTSELQPISIIEAMYFGLPLVGVAKRGTREMINGVGLLSNPSNSLELANNIIKVLTNSTSRKTLSDDSLREFDRKYALPKVVGTYENFYKTVIESYNRKNKLLRI